MTDLILMFLLSQPHRLTTLGRVLYRLAALQVAAGVAAQTVLSALRRTHDGAGFRWLGDVWPGWPAWWIPETVVGMIAVTTLGAVGLALAYRGRQWDRGWV
jgi:hypothetical protein